MHSICRIARENTRVGIWDKKYMIENEFEVMQEKDFPDYLKREYNLFKNKRKVFYAKHLFIGSLRKLKKVLNEKEVL